MLTKWQSFVSGKPRNYPEMWAKLAAVLNSVQTKEQYIAANRYSNLWIREITKDMSFARSIAIIFQVDRMTAEIHKRVLQT